MANRLGQSLLAFVLVALVPLAADAQFGRLRKIIEDKAGVVNQANPAAKKGPTQWKESERVDPFNAKELDAFIAQWKTELEFRMLPQSEQDRRHAEYEARHDQYEAKKDKRRKCEKTAVTPEDAMTAQRHIQERAMSSPGDASAIQKGAAEAQKELEGLITKRCGPDPVEPVEPRATMADMRMKEWIGAYLGARAEKGPEKAASVVLASDDEATLLEARLAKLQDLAKRDGIL